MTSENDLESTLLRLMLKELEEAVETYLNARKRGLEVMAAPVVTDETASETYRANLRAALQVCGRGHILSCCMAARIIETAPEDKLDKIQALIMRAQVSAHAWIGEQAALLSNTAGWQVNTPACPKGVN